MWEAKHEQFFPGVTKEAIWSTWADVNSWHLWDDEIDYAKLDTKFAEGNRFVLKPKGGPKVTIRLVSVVVFRSFTDVTHFPFAKMFDAHEIVETKNGVTLKSSIRVEGPLGWLWKRIVAQGVSEGVPKQMESLVRFAREKQRKASP